NAAAWKKIQLGSSAASGHAAYARLKDLMYTQLALDCVAVHASVERHLEKDRLAEEAAEDAELKRKGLLNKEGSTNWEHFIRRPRADRQGFAHHRVVRITRAIGFNPILSPRPDARRPSTWWLSICQSYAVG
ncbi:hypothetical protein B0H11DRAFT_1940591, partial [Mycena galericulata]